MFIIVGYNINCPKCGSNHTSGYSIGIQYNELGFPKNDLNIICSDCGYDVGKITSGNVIINPYKQKKVRKQSVNTTNILLEKLETYEQIAYNGGYGDEWIESIGEGFKFYIQNCVNDNIRPTIKGFENYLDDQIRKSNSNFDIEFEKAQEQLHKM